MRLFSLEFANWSSVYESWTNLKHEAIPQTDRASPCFSQMLSTAAQLLEQVVCTRYDTIRDAILTCARKPTWVSLIYRTEPTTKKSKNRKTKSRKQICSEITVNSPGNSCSEYLRRRKEGLQWEGFAEKESTSTRNPWARLLSWGSRSGVKGWWLIRSVVSMNLRLVTNRHRQTDTGRN